MQETPVEINLLEKFFIRLNNEKILYLVLRNYQKLPQSTGNSDLDIVVHKKDIEKFFDLLNEFINSNNLLILSIVQDIRCPKYCISNGKWGIQMDIFVGFVGFGNRELIPSSTLFKNIGDYRGVKILAPNVGAVLAFLKELLNNKTSSKKYLIELQNQFFHMEIDPQLLSQFRPQFRLYLNQHLNHLGKEHLPELFRIAKKDFNRSKMTGFKNKLTRLFKQPGYTIAFLGTDGSGKSTIIENIKSPLNDAFHNGVYYEHLRPNKLPSIARLIGNKVEFTGPVKNPHGSSTSGYLGSLLRWSYYMLDYTFGFYLKVWPKKAIRSCVWIFDRYYYDYLIDPKRGRIKLPYWILKFGQLIIPEPDIILCLGTDAEIIHKRKPELPLEEVERQLSELKKFCRSHRRAVWIDTGQSVEESSNQALEAILKVMAKRFELVKLTD